MNRWVVYALTVAWLTAVLGATALAQPGPDRPEPPPKPTRAVKAPDLEFGQPAGALAVADLAELVPADAIGYASWSGQEAIHAAYLKTDSARFWDEPSMVALRKELPAAIDKALAKMRQRAGEEELKGKASTVVSCLWEAARLGYRRPIGYALTHPRDMAMERFGYIGPAALAVGMIDVGDKPADRQLFVEKVYRPLMNALLREAGDTVTLESQVYQSVRLHQLAIKGDPEAIRPTWGVCRNVFFMTMCEASAKAIVDAATGKAASLANSPHYAAIRDKWGPGQPLTRSYVSFPAVGRLIKAAMDDKAEAEEPLRVIRALGLESANYGGSIRYVDRAVVANRTLMAPTKEGVLFPFSGPPLTEQEMSIVPADALAGVVFRVSPVKLYAHVRERKKIADPPAANGGARGVLNQAGEAGKDLVAVSALSLFADTGGFVVYPRSDEALTQMLSRTLPVIGSGRRAGDEPADTPAATPPLDDPAETKPRLQLIFKWKVADAGKAAAAWAPPAGLIGKELLDCFDAPLAELPEVRKFQWQGRAIEYMRDGQGGQVAWILDGDYLVVSNTIGGIMKLLSGKPAAVTSEAVKRYAAHWPRNPTMFGYVQTPLAARCVLTGLNEAIKQNKDDGDFALRTVLNVEALAAATGPVVFVASADERGVLLSEIGPTSVTGWALAGVMAGAAHSMFVIWCVDRGVERIGVEPALPAEPVAPLPLPGAE